MTYKLGAVAAEGLAAPHGHFYKEDEDSPSNLPTDPPSAFRKGEEGAGGTPQPQQVTGGLSLCLLESKQ